MYVARPRHSFLTHVQCFAQFYTFIAYVCLTLGVFPSLQLLRAYVTLFELMVVNNWCVFASFRDTRRADRA
jgi:hypothetical protein